MKSGRPRAVERLAQLTAVPAVLRAGIRVGWYEPRSTLPELARRLRATKGGHSGKDPASLLAVVDTLLFALPPLGAGRCLKRSLLLLDLWSRAGLEPALHLGYRSDGAKPIEGHAWITTRREDLATCRPPDVDEVWTG